MSPAPVLRDVGEEVKQFGLLCKRASMLCSTSSRLRLLADVHSKIEELLSTKEGKNEWTKLLCNVGLAAATSTFIMGWDESEYNIVMGWAREK